jgi:large subunit ribosomal protein L6
MSRIGKKPVAIPAKVHIDVDGQAVKVKGPRGELSMVAHSNMKVSVDDGTLHVVRPDDERQNRALHGLTRALINNMVTGVTQGFKKTLLIEGVGYHAELKSKNLVLFLGYSHPIEFPAPQGISFVVGDRGVNIEIEGIDRQLVGQTAADIRHLRPPEPYGGKGIRYSDEVVRRKAGKAGKGK